MAPGKKNPPLPNLADDARRRDPEKGSRDDGKDSPEDSPRDSPPPPPPRRARSRGGRAPPTPVETVGAKTSSKDSDAASGADASLHWGVRKMRGADPSRLFRGDASNRPVERNPTPTPAPRRSNPESVGFESLLQLADAGVQLEKRRSGAAAAAARRRARADADAQTRARKHAENSSKRVAAPTVAGKRRGRGPNKVQETEEEREAKRLRRVQANRESARQTIRRKHEMYDDLSGRAGELEKTNKCLREEVATLFGEMRALAATNASLRDDIKTAARAKGVPEPDVGDARRREGGGGGDDANPRRSRGRVGSSRRRRHDRRRDDGNTRRQGEGDARESANRRRTAEFLGAHPGRRRHARHARRARVAALPRTRVRAGTGIGTGIGTGTRVGRTRAAQPVLCQRRALGVFPPGGDGRRGVRGVVGADDDGDAADGTRTDIETAPRYRRRAYDGDEEGGGGGGGANGEKGQGIVGVQVSARNEPRPRVATPSRRARARA